MPHKGFIIDGAEVDYQDAIASSRYPVELLELLYQRRTDVVPTPSSLAGCFRRFELKRREDYYTKPESGLASAFGTAVHKALERKTSTDIYAEAYLERAVNTSAGSVIMAGTADHINSRTKTIRDYKTKRYISAGFSPPPEHVKQVNVYAWLYARLEALEWYELVYIDQNRALTFVGRLEPIEETEAWIVERLEAWISGTKNGALPQPLDSLFDAKPSGPCAYCEVFKHCKAAVERGE